MIGAERNHHTRHRICVCDLQIVLESERDASTGCMVVSPSASVSRIGSRAYEPALADIAMPIKFSIAQADDGMWR